MGNPQVKKPRKTKSKKTALATSPPKQPDLAPVENFSIILRGLEQRAANGKRFCDPDPAAAIAAVLGCTDFTTNPDFQPRFSWQGESIAVIVDADFHGKGKPTAGRIDQLVRRLPIQPFKWWTSHGGGIKLIYLALGEMTAEDLGEIVCQLLEKELSAEGLTGTEVKADSRHPAYPRGEERCSEVYDGGLTDLAAARRKMFFEYVEDADPVAWETFMGEQGWHIKQRLPHTECPIHPCEKKDNPVEIRDGGIHCYSCVGNGVCYPGILVPGWVPARCVMDGAPIRPRVPLFECCRNVTHFEQARWLLGDIPEDRAERRYKALLKLAKIVGQDDPAKVEFEKSRITKAFFRYNLVRINGMWNHSDGAHAGAAGLRDVLVSMPASHYLKGIKKGEIQVGQNQLTCGRLQSQGSNIDDLGYYSMTRINGIDLAEKVRATRLVPDNRILCTIPCKPKINMRKTVTPEELARARQIVEKDCFPGICWNYLLLVIAGKGCVQQSFGIDIPRILAMGPTGAGKTQAAKLANVLGGELPNCFKFRVDDEKFQRSYFDGSLQGAMVIYDEFEKIAKRLPGEQLLEYLLFFETGARAHLLHKGEFKIEMPAGVVLTCIDVPEALLSQAEIGRRWVLADVGAGSETGADWIKTSGTMGVENWLTLDATGSHCEARDTILSYVRNEFFNGDREWTFQEIAEKLGFYTLDKAADSADEKYLEFLKMFRPAGVATSGRLKGYVVVNVNGDGPLDRMFAALTEGGKRTANLKGVRWAILAKEPGLKIGIKADVDTPGKFGVRFYTP